MWYLKIIVSLDTTHLMTSIAAVCFTFHLSSMREVKHASKISRKMKNVGVLWNAMLEKRSTITWMGIDHYRCVDLNPVVGLMDYRKSCLKQNLKCSEVLISRSGQSRSSNSRRGMASSRPHRDAEDRSV